MKLTIFSLLLLGLCGINCKNTRKLGTNKNTYQSADGFQDTHVVAHRGAWKALQLPQNSVASLRHAISMHLPESETDVRMTADGYLAIIHDPDYNGMLIRTHTLAELRSVKLPNGEVLPLLNDFLKIIAVQQNTRLVIELKPTKGGAEWDRQSVQKVLEAVDSLNVQSKVMYISFDYEMCKQLVRLSPGNEVQYLEGDKAPGILNADRITGLDYHYSVFQKHPEYIREAKQLGLSLNAWTVDHADIMDWLLANDFDYITTNEPELLLDRINNSTNKQINK